MQVESVEKELEKCRDIVMGSTNNVCDMRRLDGHRRNMSEGFNDEVGRAVAKIEERSGEGG